jgi:hypothetical protein
MNIAGKLTLQTIAVGEVSGNAASIKLSEYLVTTLLITIVVVVKLVFEVSSEQLTRTSLDESNLLSSWKYFTRN